MRHLSRATLACALAFCANLAPAPLRAQVPQSLPDPAGKTRSPLPLRRQASAGSVDGASITVAMYGLKSDREHFDPAVLAVFRQAAGGRAQLIWRERYGCSGEQMCTGSSWITGFSTAVLGGQPLIMASIYWLAGANNEGYRTDYFVVDAGSVKPVQMASPVNSAMSAVQGVGRLQFVRESGLPTLEADGVSQVYSLTLESDPRCCGTGGDVRVTFTLRRTGGAWWLMPTRYVSATPPERRPSP